MPGPQQCIVCQGTQIVCDSDEYVCLDCGSMQTQIRNEADEDDFADPEQGRTLHLPTFLAERAEEVQKDEVELWSALQKLLIVMGESAARLAGVHGIAVVEAVKDLWFDYLTRLEEDKKLLRDLTTRKSKKRTHLALEVDGRVSSKQRDARAPAVPQLGPALLLALLWLGLVAARAAVLAVDVVGWLHVGSLGVSAEELQQALRAVLRQRTRRTTAKRPVRRTSRWHLLGRPPGLPAQVLAVDRAAQELREHGLAPGRFIFIR